jgi:type I restriction enzyme S subunit
MNKTDSNINAAPQSSHSREGGNLECPSCWIIEKLGEIAEVKGGKRIPKGDILVDVPTSHPYIRVTDFENGSVNLANLKYITNETFSKISNYTIGKSDIYISIAGTIGSIGEVPDIIDGANLTENAAKICNIKSINKRYVRFFLQGPTAQDLFKKSITSSGQPKLALFRIRDCSIPLPPLAEQKIIADKLDELLAQVDTLRARLDAIPATLKRLRQSVLAAAVSGKLTEEWRTGRDLQIWSNLTLLDVVVEKPRNGFSPKGVNYDTPYKNLTLSSTTLGHFVEGKFKYIDADIPANSHLWVKNGDVLIQRANSLEYVGVSAVYRGKDSKYVYPDLMMKITPKNGVIPEYLHYELLSGRTRRYFKDNATGTAGNMPKINQGVVSNTPIALPPTAEQTEIVRQVELYFSHADQVEQQVKNAQARVNQLTQSILAKAFRGELTEQWRQDNPELISGDNSAAALLQRIKAERAAAKPAKKTQGRKVQC